MTAESILAWMNGESRPTEVQAGQLANKLRIPYLILFLDSEPDIDAFKLPDLRTIRGNPITDPSINFIDTLNDVTLRQDWFRGYRQLGVSARTIDRWQSLRCGPQRVAVGRTILYSLDSVRQWLESREQAKSVDRKRRLFCPAVPLVRGPGFSMLGN